MPTLRHVGIRLTTGFVGFHIETAFLGLTKLQMRMPHSGKPVKIRVGMHSGPCVSGLIGLRLPK
jgi:hypothetical protein